MKKAFFLVIGILLLGLTTQAQVKIGDDPADVHSSAALEVRSTTRGVLLSRLITSQMEAIPTPEIGLMVFNTTLNKICVYNGTQWACTNDGSGGKKKNDNSYEGTSNDPKTRKE